MSQRPSQRYFLADLVMAVLLCGLVAALFTSARGAVDAWLVFFLIIVVSTTWSVFRARRRAPTCEECGRRFIPPKQADEPTICPQCRIRHLRPDEAKSQRSRDMRVGYGFLAMLAILVAFLFPRPGGVRSGIGSWIGFLLVVLGTLATMFGTLVGWFLLLQLRRRRQLRSEQGVLEMARKSVARDGEVVNEGPWTIWYSGAEDPTPMLRDQMDVACRRFATLTGEADVAEPPQRIFVFHDRGAFMRFHLKIIAGLDLTTLDGLQLGSPYRLITLCTAPAACRITDPERTVRSLAAYALLESAWGPKPPVWLQAGLGRSIAGGGDRDELGRLNRKMAVALDLGTAMSAEMFAMTPKEWFRLVRGPKEPGKLQKAAQVNNQSWSIVEYLVGEPARPEPAGPARPDPRAALGAFLRDPRSKTDPEGSFRDHFGLGFGPLLDGWRRWVLDRGIGTYEPPPDRIRDAMLERVLPVIRDRQAKRGDRLVAIGEWASAGFVLGADALIGVLRDPRDLPKEQVVWALCMVSGMAWGDEPDRWQAWWDDLPTEWEGPAEAAATPAGGLPAEPIATAPEGEPASAQADR